MNTYLITFHKLKPKNMRTLCFVFLFGLLASFKASNNEADLCANVSLDKMDMVYIGLENPFTVSVKGVAADKIIVKCTGGTTKQTNPGKYVLVPDGSDRGPTITVTVKMPDGTVKPASVMQLRARKMNHPETLIGTRNGGKLTIEELKSMTQINAGLGEGFPIEGIRFKVIGYTMVITHKDGGNYIEPVNGNKITDRTREEFANIKPGDFVNACQIELEGPTGKMFLSGCTLEIK